MPVMLRVRPDRIVRRVSLTHSLRSFRFRLNQNWAFCSIDQAFGWGRQEAVVKNIVSRRPLLEFEILGDLIDRALEARGVDAADAIALHFIGEYVVGDYAVQPFQFEIGRSVLHPACDLIRSPFRFADRDLRPADQRAQEALYSVRPRGGKGWIDDDGKAVGLAAIVGIAKHCEVI